MKLLLKSLNLLLLLGSFVAQANTIKAIYANEKLHWQNAQFTSDGYLVPTIWSPIEGLVPTKTWIPGGLSAAQSSMSIQSLDKSRRLDFSTDEFHLVGVEYHTGSSRQKIGEASNLGAVQGVCATSLNVPLVSVIGDSFSCFSSNQLELEEARQAPFSLMRPIFRVDEQAIITKLKTGFSGKHYPEGNYQSDLAMFNAFYHYYYDPMDTDTPILTKRQVSAAFGFELEVKPEARLDVRVKNGEHQQMQIMYFPDGRIEGTAQFEFEISGLLPLGYTMRLSTFRRNKTSEYNLINTDDSTKTIPYSLTWRSAEDALNNGIILVDKGTEAINFIKDSVCVLNSDSELCEGRYLDVDFKLDTEQANKITSGMYQSQLTVLFEPNL